MPNSERKSKRTNERPEPQLRKSGAPGGQFTYYTLLNTPVEPLVIEIRDA
jgi:hypothetical protein